MSAALATLALALIAAGGFAVATSLVVAAAWPLARRALAAAHPAVRALAVWLAAAAPALLPALLLALCFLPGLLGAVGLANDHCTHHPDHVHLCLFHATAALTPARSALLAAALLVAAAAVVPDLRRLAGERRWLARLSPPSSRSGSRFRVSERAESGVPGDVEIVESETPLSFTAGLWRPRVHVASSLVRALPGRLLDAVLAHERAHARRRDSLLRLGARALSRAHLPPVRRALLAELELASEQACDAEAGRRVGDRLVVAEAILAVERLLAGAADPVPPGLSAFGRSSVAARVQRLLEDEPRRLPREAAWLAAAIAAVAALAGVEGLHHATEHLLAIATRWL